MIRSLYEVLQVRPDADPEVIAAAYRALSKRYHPDVNKAADSTRMMKEINSAYKILNDPVERAKYDRSLPAQQDTRPSAQNTTSRKSEQHSDEAPDKGRAQQKTSSPEVRVQNTDGRFIAYDNGTVLDTRTNLMWAVKDNGADINWQGAKSYCENYLGGGYKNWRMPPPDELEGLYDTAKTYKADRVSDVHLTELIRLTGIWVWASETRGPGAATFGFSSGKRYCVPQSDVYGNRALPVRSGK